FTGHLAIAIHRATCCEEMVYAKGELQAEALRVMVEKWEQVRQVLCSLAAPDMKLIQAEIEWEVAHALADCRRLLCFESLSGGLTKVGLPPGDIKGKEGGDPGNGGVSEGQPRQSEDARTPGVPAEGASGAPVSVPIELQMIARLNALAGAAKGLVSAV